MSLFHMHMWHDWCEQQWIHQMPSSLFCLIFDAVSAFCSALCLFLYWHTDRCTNSCPWPCATMCLELSRPEQNNAGMCSAFTPVCPYDLIYNNNACVTKRMSIRLIGVFHMGTLVVTAGIKWPLSEVFVNCDIYWEFVVFSLECQHFRHHFPKLFPKILHFKFLGVYADFL